MPYIETPDDLAEHLADLLGIYNDPRCNEPYADWSCSSDSCLAEHDDAPHCHTFIEHCGPEHGDYEVIHIADCLCRVWWVPIMADRIRAAVTNEARVAR